MASTESACRFFVKGNCKYGEACRHSHATAPTRSDALSTHTTPKPPKMTRDQRTVQKAMRDAGKLVIELSPTSDIEAQRKEIVTIENYQFLASYNWKDAKFPTIYVPGSPPKWTPLTVPCRIPEGKGRVLIDKDSRRTQAANFDPLFKALLTTQPSFNMARISLVTDRNSLRKLLRFTSNQNTDSWRMDIDLVEDTMFFSRWELNTTQLISGATAPGRGHEFERAFTRFESRLEDSMSHDRIVRYNLGGIECLVRFEVDAYVEDAVIGTASTTPGGSDISAVFETLSLNRPDKEKSGLGLPISKVAIQEREISSTFETLTSNSISSASSPSNEVKVIQRGSTVPPHSMAELKCTTRPQKNSELIPQLWFSQTHYVFLARHQDGLISQPVEQQLMTDKMAEWETDNASSLREMVRVIEEIKRAVTSLKGKRQCMLIFEKGKSLKLFERKGRGLMLGKGVREKCWQAKEDNEA